VSRRHHARRRRSYGRRQHELRQRRPRHDLDDLARESMQRDDAFLTPRDGQRSARDDRAAA
jgi:hypothetical protein